MIWLVVVLALLLFAALMYIFLQRKQYQDLFGKLNKLFDDAANSNTPAVSYDESVASALGDKILRYITASKEHFADVQNERNKIKTLISDISHQTRTPVANILLYSGLLLESKGLNESAAQMAQDIGAQAEKLKFLLDALVKMSRLETGILTVEAKPQTIKPLISAAVSQCYPAIEGKKIDLSVNISETLTANFDMKWTKEAVYNILDNAVKYTETGGSISIRAVEHEMFVKIDFSDSGAGIREDEYAKIFKRFYRSPRTRAQDGIGVGLSLAREIVTLEGGYIKVASELGTGSVFSVYLLKS